MNIRHIEHIETRREYERRYNEGPWYICPVCGSEIPYDEDCWLNEDGDVVGCRCCLARIDAHLCCREEDA